VEIQTKQPTVKGPGELFTGDVWFGFFVITLDAVVVNVALPSIRNDLGAGMTGLKWVVDL
jgi:MFS transporter, DHA2 family, methylenomycin A resistance protein